MTIIILDEYNERDPMQKNIYDEIHKHFSCQKVSKISDVPKSFDFIYFGIYALTMDSGEIRRLLSKAESIGAGVMIDQADDDESVGYLELFTNITKKVLFTRYAHNRSLFSYSKYYNCPLVIMPWTIKKLPTQMNKNNDLNFTCSMYGRRIKVKSMMENIAARHNLKIISGEVFGNEYQTGLQRSKIAVMECFRNCMTQKYVEAISCGAIPIGDIPKYPEWYVDLVGDCIVEADINDEKDTTKIILDILENYDYYHEKVQKAQHNLPESGFIVPETIKKAIKLMELM